jgi:excisionase family DNA binding protein
MSADAELLTIADSAELLGVSERSIRNWITDGKLCAFRVAEGRLIRIRRHDVEALLSAVGADEA